jgi:5-methylcytosine-specific restriction endonuclease McrA
MWRVERPVFDAVDTYRKCISKVRETALSERLRSIVTDVADSAAEYANCAQAAALYAVSQTSGMIGNVSVDELVAVYTDRMAKKDAPGRDIYDAIKLLPKYGVCPFCGHRSIATLDHVLPKTLFPVLAVAPDNLVGCCSDCNKEKLSLAPTVEEDAFLHPYFECAETKRWLVGEVIEGSVAAIVFGTRNVEGWTDAFNERIRRQFRCLGLQKLYGDQAAREISDQSLLLGRIYDGLGSDGVRSEMVKQAETREAHQLNSWQAATFRALSQSEWFCDGGFGAT